MIGDFVSSFPELSDFVIIRVFIGDEEGSTDWTSIWVSTLPREQGVVINHVVSVD